MMNGPEKSDSAIVAKKPANKAGRPAAERVERVERRAGTEGNTGQPRTHRTQSRGRVLSGLDSERTAARQGKKDQFTGLLHHVSIDRLREAYPGLKRQAAPGVDGVTWRDCEAGLEGNLQDLHTRVHRGSYRALPLRRRYIPKPDGRERPLGIAALEDKIVQRALVMVLNAVVAGYFAYHAVPTNARAHSAFRHHVIDLWRRTLRRRSQKDGLTWDRITRIVDSWLPPLRILHPWPNQRFAVKHPR